MEMSLIEKRKSLSSFEPEHKDYKKCLKECLRELNRFGGKLSEFREVSNIRQKITDMVALIAYIEQSTTNPLSMIAGTPYEQALFTMRLYVVKFLRDEDSYILCGKNLSQKAFIIDGDDSFHIIERANKIGLNKPELLTYYVVNDNEVIEIPFKELEGGFYSMILAVRNNKMCLKD